MISSSGKQGSAESLSPREQQILDLAAKGLADKEIARKIKISVGTVRTYWQRMRDKTNSRSRSEVLCRTLQKYQLDVVNEIQRQHHRFLALFESSAVGLALLNEQDEIVEVNSVFARVLKATEAALLGRPVKVLTGSTVISIQDSAYQWQEVNLQTPEVTGDEIGYRMCRQQVELEGKRCSVLTLLRA